MLAEYSKAQIDYCRKVRNRRAPPDAIECGGAANRPADGGPVRACVLQNTTAWSTAEGYLSR